MQIIERRIGQSILLRIGGEEVEVRLHSTARGKAKIGIIAPRSVTVERAEVASPHTDQLNGGRQYFAAGDPARVRRPAAAPPDHARRQ